MSLPMPKQNNTPQARRRTPDWRPDTARILCRLADMPEDATRGFILTGEDGQRLDIIVWRDGDALRGFVNQCPHLGLPLETFPDRFLSADGRHLICSAHGAQFDASGACFAGPCKGAALVPLALGLEEKDGETLIMLAAPPQPNS